MHVCAALAILFLCCAAPLVKAAPGLVTVTLTPPGPVKAGQNFRLTFRMVDYTDAVPIDGFRFRVSFPPQLFLFIPGSELTGTASGPDQQWLSKATQERDGFELGLETDAHHEGMVDFYLRDIGPSLTESGTVAESGFLLSFELRGRGEGTGLIHPTAFPDPAGAQSLFRDDGTPAGIPSFNATFMRVDPGISLTIRRDSTNVVVSWPAHAAGYVLERKNSLNSNTSWSAVTAEPAVSDSRYQVTFPWSAGPVFWRLRQL